MVENYTQVAKYHIEACCKDPLHIGNGTVGEILIHPVTHQPFIQASTLAGVFRSYYEQKCEIQDKEKKDSLFGGVSEKKTSSAIHFLDAVFDESSLEVRPHLKINPETGTCDEESVGGSGMQSGQKFDMVYVAAGAKFHFDVYLYEEKDEDDLQNVWEEILMGCFNNEIRIGGLINDGCGNIEWTSVRKKVFHLRNEKERAAWMHEEEGRDYGKDIKGELKARSTREHRWKYAYEIVVEAETDGEMLIKAIGVDAGEEQNVEPMKNQAGEFIIPGSTLKGILRSQSEKILNYIGQPDEIEKMFGRGANKSDNGMVGQIRVLDTVITENQIRNPKRTRIAIDKFTGGVKYGAMMKEKTVSGKLTMQVQILHNPCEEKQCALLMLVLRDMAIGALSVGSGRGIGRGYLSVHKITVMKNTGEKAVLCPKDGKIEDGTKMLNRCFKAFQDKENTI